MLEDRVLTESGKKTKDQLTCFGCVQGCLGNLRKNIPIQCLVNPRTVKEYACDLTPVPEDQKKKVVIADGGVAGLEAAVAAAAKGHDVTVYEKSDRLGGHWIKASVPSAKQYFTTLVVWCRTRLEKRGVFVGISMILRRDSGPVTRLIGLILLLVAIAAWGYLVYYSIH